MKKRFLITAVMALLALVGSPAGTALAAGSYTVSNIGPTMYQTNLWYSGAEIAPLAGTPTTPITSVRYSWAWNNTTSVPPGLLVQLCNSARCVSLPTTFASGTTSAFNGDNANTGWRFHFASSTSTTYVFNPYFYGGKNQVIANY